MVSCRERNEIWLQQTHLEITIAEAAPSQQLAVSLRLSGGVWGERRGF